MATFVAYHCFACDLANGVHRLACDTLKILLSNTAPTVATDRKRCDTAEIGGGPGYTSGGCTLAVTGSSQNGGVYKLTVTVDPIWSGGAASAIGPFRYSILYNSSTTSPSGGALMAYWDYGSSITLNQGEMFTVDLDATNGVLTIT